MSTIDFLWYPKCSTARKAKKWLDEQGILYNERDIITDNPTAAELKKWHAVSDLPTRRLFNTSGILYREQGVKKQLDAGMTKEEAYALLASDGMMVKRPIVIGKDFALFGFKQAEWEENLLPHVT